MDFSVVPSGRCSSPSSGCTRERIFSTCSRLKAGKFGCSGSWRFSRSASSRSFRCGSPSRNASSSPPQLGVGAVVELDPQVGAVDRDRGRQAFQHLALGGDRARQLVLQVLRLGAVDRQADQAVALTFAGPVAAQQRHLHQLHQPALAGDHDVVALALDLGRRARPLRQRPADVAQGIAQQLGVLRHRRGARALDRAGVGVVAVDQAQVAPAPPDRHRDRVQDPHQQVAGRRGVLSAARVVGDVAEPDRRPRGVRPALRAQGAGAVGGRQRQRERRALGAQRPGGGVEPFAVARRQPVDHGVQPGARRLDPEQIGQAVRQAGPRTVERVEPERGVRDQGVQGVAVGFHARQPLVGRLPAQPIAQRDQTGAEHRQHGQRKQDPGSGHQRTRPRGALTPRRSQVAATDAPGRACPARRRPDISVTTRSPGFRHRV
ncbi:hypothetical protein CKO28_22065 [Rhodovibrio sodomensis]|uniref:Uncharacterized protein n=1 Tax=Rhodovibrio sodomensis TaxID=1088 RepID=A0ABS1DJP6_9PROT|nr:hypothetical protein [Rhodovibrio sodomensis]MBK1670710.1 hypothetical protein [Rhodovibrio sodomensis]